MKYYVYTHINPVTREPFYIGKGRGDRCRSSTGRNGAWRKYVRQIQQDGSTYGINILHVCDSETEALQREMSEVRKLLAVGKKVLNRVYSFDKDTVLVDEPVRRLGDPLAIFVKTRRKKLKLTQQELADRAGVGLRFIRELERGKSSLRLDVVDNVLRLFGGKVGVIPMEVDNAG